MSQSSDYRFLSSTSSSSHSSYVPPGKKYNNSRFQRPESNAGSSSQSNRFLKPSSSKSCGDDGWKTLNNHQTGNRCSNSKRGYKFLANQKKPEKKNKFMSSDGDFPTLGAGREINVSVNNFQNTLNYSNAINEDIEMHKKNIQPPPRKFVSLVTLKKKKKYDEVEFKEDVEFQEDVEREEDYLETTYFTGDEEEYYEEQEAVRRAEQDYDY